jgi:hypothetical protein
MNIESLKHVINTYSLSLDLYSIEQLRYKPDEERWSLGQMYVHVIYASLEMYYPAIRTCMHQPDSQAILKTDAGSEIFTRGAYPPVKVKTADIPANPDSKHPLRKGLQMILEQAVDLLPLIARSAPDAKVMHSRLGALNAKEWFQLAEMHMRHHLLQKKELEESLAV